MCLLTKWRQLNEPYWKGVIKECWRGGKRWREEDRLIITPMDNKDPLRWRRSEKLKQTQREKTTRLSSRRLIRWYGKDGSRRNKKRKLRFDRRDNQIMAIIDKCSLPFAVMWTFSLSLSTFGLSKCFWKRIKDNLEAKTEVDAVNSFAVVTQMTYCCRQLTIG